MQRTLGCHDGSSTMPKAISPETPGEMPNVADHWLNGSGQHGQIHLPQIEQPGHHALRQPDTLPGESVREPSAFDRAQSSSRPAETPDPVGPRPEQRATTNPELQSGTPQANGTSEARKSEPTAADFAQSAEPASPPKAAQRPTEPTPAVAATASEPSRVPDRTAASATPDPPAEPPPMLGPEVEAFTLGGISGFFGIFVEGLADFGDLMFDTFAMHGDKPGARDDWEKARDEFRTSSEETGRVALDKDETFGSAGMVLGGVGPDFANPSSKAQAAGAAGTAAKKAVQTYVKGQVVKKTLKKTAKFAVEKVAAYKKLAKEGKLWTKPVSESQGSWFQKWVAKKDYEYVGELKNRKTVQIDDLATATDGKLVLIEVKFMKKTTAIGDSGHVRFADEKVEHLERLLQFYKENRDTVSHIEITVSREEAAQIYADIVVASPHLEEYMGTIIRFGMP
jgi:hypothetical protein